MVRGMDDEGLNFFGRFILFVWCCRSYLDGRPVQVMVDTDGREHRVAVSNLYLVGVALL